MTLIYQLNSKFPSILTTNSKVYLYSNKQIKLYIEVARRLHEKIEVGQIKCVTMIDKLENHKIFFTF